MRWDLVSSYENSFLKIKNTRNQAPSNPGNPATQRKGAIKGPSPNPGNDFYSDYRVAAHLNEKEPKPRTRRAYPRKSSLGAHSLSLDSQPLSSRPKTWVSALYQSLKAPVRSGTYQLPGTKAPESWLPPRPYPKSDGDSPFLTPQEALHGIGRRSPQPYHSPGLHPIIVVHSRSRLIWVRIPHGFRD